MGPPPEVADKFWRPDDSVPNLARVTMVEGSKVEGKREI
jgi:hypothetical protein